jgi:hypothetical protein
MSLHHHRASFGSLAVALALIALLLGLAAATPGHSARQDDVYTAWIPPGEYTAIVLCSNADTRRWNVRLMSRNGANAPDEQVSIVVPPREMVVIPFERGWNVRVWEKARLESDLVPFDEFAEGNPVTGEGNIALSAWGIGPDGPVPFTYRALKD